MIKVSEAAMQGLATFFEGKDVRPIRIQFAEDDCNGSGLLLTLDDYCSGDKYVTYNDLTFLINERLAEAAGDVYIDTSTTGFSVDCEKPVNKRYERTYGSRDCGT